MADLHSYVGYLNVVLFESSPDDMRDVGRQAQERIEAIHRSRVEDRAICWLPEQAASTGPKAGDSHNRRFYRPRVYTTTGTFDVAALFLSPKMELSPWAKPESLRRTGQDIHMCLLPQGSCFGCGVEADFNRTFSTAYSQPGLSNLSATRLPDNELFVGIVKLKLNPSVVWPKLGTPPSRAQERLSEILELIGTCVNAWRDSTKVSPVGDRPLVAMGLDVGWSEIMVIAHADDPSKILSLLTRLRQINAPSSFVRGKVSHLFATSITTIGADYRLRQAAHDIWHGLAKARRRVPAKRLLQLARESDGGTKPAPEGAVRDCYLQIGCDAYPGHEKLLLELFTELRAELEAEGLLARDRWPGTNYGFEAGKRDVWTPPLVLNERLPPVRAWVLHGLIQLWARSSGTAFVERYRILSCFDFHTRFGCLDDHAEEDLHLTSIPLNHIAEYPAWHIRNARHYAPLIHTIDRRLIRDLRRSMAVLQVPYALAEQVVNLASTFYWAWHREVLWDESVEILPVVLALEGNLAAYAKWWKRVCEKRYELEPLPPSPYESAIPPLGLQEHVGRHLHHLFDRHMPRLLQAFRAHFYNRHFASYFTDGLPDANLRFRGSVQQLLSVANMIVDTFASVVLGWRGSMAIIGDTTSPEVSAPCDVLLVRLNLGALSAPILLESIGHEIGHHFVLELANDTKSGGMGWRLHGWVGPPRFPAGGLDRLDRLRSAFQRLSEEVFLGELFVSHEKREHRIFIESTGDLIEFLLLGYDSVDEWATSVTLRMVLAGYPTTRPIRNEWETGLVVPYLDERVVLGAIIRCVVVQIALALAGKAEVPDLRTFIAELVARELESLRVTLRTRCTLGPSLDAARQLTLRGPGPGGDDKCWESFLDNEIFQGLPWLADAMALGPAWEFYRALVDYLSWVPSEASAGSERFLIEIRTAFRDLRKEFLNQFLPALYVRHWMGPRDEHVKGKSREVNPAGRDFERYYDRPWRVTPQPHAAMAALGQWRQEQIGPLEPYKSTIFQRGTILARENDVQKQWMDTHSRFFLRLIALIPSWRSAILEKAALIEKEQADAAKNAAS